MYTVNTSDAWHIPRYPTRKHCVTSIYIRNIILTIFRFPGIYMVVLTLEASSREKGGMGGKGVQWEAN